VNISDNPIYLTQKRLTHRTGLLAPILIAALIGLSLLAGLIAYLADSHGISFRSPQEAGKMFYGWTVGVEVIVLIVGGFSKISRVLADDRKAGLWDSNRLTPMSPAQIVGGYWLGSALREFYMAMALAGIGLPIVLLAKLPLTLWFGTQVLILGTALFFGLLAMLVGMALQRPQGGLVMFLFFFLFFVFFQASSSGLPRFAITNFLVPIYGIVNLFSEKRVSEHEWFDWYSWPEIYGLAVPPVLLSLGLQFVLGVFLWRAAVRKTANPFQPLLLRWEAIAIFALLIAVQHGLIWGIWHGDAWNATTSSSHYVRHHPDALLSIVHGGTILAGVLMLAFASPLPERVRVESLRVGAGDLRLVFARSAVSLAFALAAAAAIASVTQFVFSFNRNGIAWALATGNLLVFFLMFSLLLEFCRLRFNRRSLGFVALGLFLLCVLPFILAGVFSNEALAKLSFLAPGVTAVAGPNGDGRKYLVGVTCAHFGVVVLLYFAWRRQWKLLLAQTSSSSVIHRPM